MTSPYLKRRPRSLEEALEDLGKVPADAGLSPPPRDERPAPPPAGRASLYVACGVALVLGAVIGVGVKAAYDLSREKAARTATAGIGIAPRINGAGVAPPAPKLSISTIRPADQ